MDTRGHGSFRFEEEDLNLHAPPPRSHSGVADYAEALHRKLLSYGVPAVPLYHLGNNRLHADIYRQALAAPGVIVLHDAVLHHFLLGTLSREEYIGEFVYNYGEWHRHLAENLWTERGGSAIDPRYFRYPMLKRVVERSSAVIVHNPGAASIAREHGAVSVHLIPHFFATSNLADAADTALLRDRIGVPANATLFGIFGYLRETKRVLPTIQAFNRLHRARPATALLLAGEVVSPDLARLLATEEAQPGIVRLPHLSERDLTIAAAAIDCCVNLRYPAAGETSGIAVRMMGTGKPVILTDSEENSDIPPAACLRVCSGVAEAAELSDHMILVSEFPRVAKDIGTEARRHILERHSLEDAARQYWQVLCAASSH
jgi:glycosyltransferase involved in cell wall biosynthesis